MQLPKVYAQNIQAKAIDLSLSTNPLGCSPMVINALRKIQISDLSSYPKSQKVLIDIISQKFGVESEQILLGNGSEQLIKLACQTFLEQDDIVLVEDGSFPLFSKESILAGAKVTFFDFSDIRKSNKIACLLLFANPKTPSGESITNKQIRSLLNRLRPEVAIIDEANGEFLKKSFVQEISELNNVIVLRTFSKVFGLAGLRIAFAIGSKNLINKLQNSQQPFSVSSLAIKAAIAALEDNGFVNQSLKFFTSERRFLVKELKNRGFEIPNSITNNLLICSPIAPVLVKSLNQLGVSVIDGSFFPNIKRSGFRISIRDRRTNLMFLQKLDQALSKIAILKKE